MPSSRFARRFRSVAALAALAASACGGGEEAPVAAAQGPYPASGEDALFRGDVNRIGGTTGGFGERLGYADVTYSLGTGAEPVPGEEIDALLTAYAPRLVFSEEHRADLRRVLGERPAFRAWEAYLSEGGSVRTFTPPSPERLRTLPPERLVLAGNGRYLPDRLLILGRSRETAMDEFLFHEIQHYVLDRWDSPLFEAGEADHQVIALIEERRRIVESLRRGRLPKAAQFPRLLHDAGGAATAALEAGRFAEALERAGAEDYYLRWVEGAISRIESKNENSRRVRIVSTSLSDGRTLLFDERSDRTDPDEVKAMDARVPPHYRYGPVVYVSLRDLRRFDLERVFGEAGVGEEDRAAVESFVAAHRDDPGLGRQHIFTPAQIQDLAHLSAYGAALFQGALHLAAARLAGSATEGEASLADADYQRALSSFLESLVARMRARPGGDPRGEAEELWEGLGASAARPAGAVS